MATTIDDVARLAGVSKATVSRVFHGENGTLVRDSTRRRVEAAAEELDYRPSLFASGLKTKRTSLVGVIARDLTNPFWAGMVDAVTATCSRRGYHVTLTSVSSHIDAAIEGARLTRLGYDGTILIGDSQGDEQILSEVLSTTGAVVAVARTSLGTRVPCVRVDNTGAIESIVALLTGLGHQRIAFIGTGADDSVERRMAFVQSLHARGLTPNPNHVRAVVTQGPLSIQTNLRISIRIAKGLLGCTDRPTAIVASNDGMAIGVLVAARACGLSVPEDLSIVGFDGQLYARYASPPLTMAVQPVRQMGETAATMLLDIIEGRGCPRPGTVIRLPVRLVCRSSHGPVSAWGLDRNLGLID